MRLFIVGLVQGARTGVENAAVAARDFLAENSSVLRVPQELLARLDLSGLIGRGFFAEEPNGHGLNGTPVELTADDMPDDLEKARHELHALLGHMDGLLPLPLNMSWERDLHGESAATAKLMRRTLTVYMRELRKLHTARNGSSRQERPIPLDLQAH